MMTASRCGRHSGLGSGVSSVSPGSLGSGSGLLMAAGPCHQGAHEPNNGVTILPVTAENLARLDNSRDIDLSFPITSTYLRQMRHRPEPELTCAAAGPELDEEDDEVGHIAILYRTKSDRNRTLTSDSEYWRTSAWLELEVVLL